jgi:Initiator Replication protein
MKFMDKVVKEKNSDLESHSQELKAPQAVVHIKHSITLRQYKVWLVILQKYREFYESGEALDDDGYYRFPKSELDELIGYETTKADIRRDLIALRKEDIILSVTEKGGEKAEEFNGFISRARLTSKTIAVEIPFFLKKVMEGLDQPRAMFQLLNWQIFNHFSGKYEAVIYKLCRDYIGVRNTPYMSLEDFKGYMGIKEGDYQDFRRLNTRVITEPVAKINQSPVSDIKIDDIVYRKDGRKVLGLYFVVSRKNQTSIPFPELEQNPAFRFAKVHIEVMAQTEYLALRSPQDIELCIERANEYGEGESVKGKEPNYGAIYRKAINEGWHTSYADKKAKQKALEAQKEKAAQSEKESAQTEAQKKAQQLQWIENTLTAFAELPENQKEDLRAIFAAGLGDLTRKSFDKHGEKAPMHRMKFAQFVEQHLYK